MKTQSHATTQNTDAPAIDNARGIGAENAALRERRETSNRPRPSRRACALLSWAAVAIMLVFIFFMSAKTGNDLDNHSGIISVIKNLLAVGATALFGHEVDVSPVGHFTEYLLLGAALANALRFTSWTAFEKNAVAHPAGMLGDCPTPLVALIFSSLYGVSDEFHQIFTPSRSCDPMDWLVDTCAAAIGAAIVWALLKRHYFRSQ